MIVLRYENLLDVADVAKDWYSGQGDPVYALVSSVYAGRDVPLSIADGALSNLERDYNALKKRKPAGWRDDGARLQGAISELEFQIMEARQMNPSPTMNSALGIGLIIGIGTLAFYLARGLGSAVGTSVGTAV